jgi:hypothetical protein
MSKAQATLAAVKSGDDLAAVQVTGSDGSSRPLVPATVSASDRDAAASSLAQLATISGGLPADGSRQQAASPAAAGVIVPRALAPADIGSSIAVAAGDLFRWLGQAATDVEDFVIQEAEGLYHFVATIAGQAYHALLDCYDAVVHAVEFVLGKIEVFFEDLVQWLGFVFQWSDIVRTHQVLRNYIRQFVAYCAGSIPDIRTGLQASFTQAQEFIDSWAGIPAGIPPGLVAGTADSSTRSAAPPPGQSSPQGNWGTQLLRGNAASGSVTGTVAALGDDVLAAVQALSAAVTRELDVVQAAITRLKTDVLDKFHELSFAQIMEGVIAIFSDALLQSIENLLLALLDVLEALADGVVGLLDTAIDIPVISGLYREISGDDLSLLDVTCLIMAIPVTICGKLLGGAAPFPDDATTAALIAAPDFAAIQQILKPPTARPAALEFAVSAPHDDSDAADPDSKITKDLVLAAGFMALHGEYAETIIGGLRRDEDLGTNPLLLLLAAGYYLPYNAPGFVGDIPNLAKRDGTNWPDWMNIALTGYMAYKALVDVFIAQRLGETWTSEVEPWLNGLASLIWLVPTTAAAVLADQSDPVTWLNFAAGIAFCGNGIMEPIQEQAKDPVTRAVLDGIAIDLNHIWGLLSVAAGAVTFAR